MKHKITTSIFIVSMAFAISVGCTKGCSESKEPPTPQAPAKGAVSEIEGMKIEDSQVGDGDEALQGKSVTVQYTGTFLENGQKFDSSYDHGQPFTFNLGAHQ